MKTRTRLILERRFGQWAAGKALRLLSAAALLGLTLSSTPAEAQDGSVCSYGGYGGPSVSILVNDVLVDTRSGSDVVDLAGTYRVVSDSGEETVITIAGADEGFAPIAYVDKGTGVSLLVVTDLFITSAFPDGAAPARLKLVVNSDEALDSGCPGGTHTFAATMDGAALTESGIVSITAEAIIPDPFGEGESKRIVVNRRAGDDEIAPSLIAGVAGSPLLPGGGYADAVVEDSACGTRFTDEDGSDSARFDCDFRLQNTIEFTFLNPGDSFYSAGSFKSAVLESAVEDLGGATGASVVLGSTGVPFARFNAAVVTQPRWDTFEVGALFRLGPLSNGLNPVNEPFSLRAGGFTGSLAANSFVQRSIFGRKFYVFDGIIDDGSPTGSRFKAVLTPLLGGWFSLVATGRGSGLTAAGKTLVDLTIGSDNGGGQAKVVAIPRY